MSEQERAAYYKQVEAEFEKELERQAQPAPQKPKPEIIKPEPVQEPVQKTKEKEIKVKISDKEKAIKDAVTLIKELTEAIDSFLIKLEAKEDFFLKLSKWGKKKKIQKWNTGFEWKQMKQAIDLFRAQLDKLKDRDPKTKKYKYLSDLLENKELYNQLYNFSVDLADYEPTVRVARAKPLTKKIRRKSHKAIRSLINVFVELLFADETMIDTLEKLFIKFDPEAQRIKAEEEKAAAKSLEESRKKETSRRVRAAGRQGKSQFDLTSDYGQSDYDYGDEPYYGGYERYDDSYSPDWDRDSMDRRQSTRRPVSKTKPSPTKKAPKPVSTKIKPEEDDEKHKKDRRAKKLLRSYEDALETISDFIEENQKIKNLYDYIKADQFDKKIANKIVEIKGLAERAHNKLETMSKRLNELGSKPKKAFGKDLKALYDEYKDTLENISKNIEKVTADKEMVEKLSPDVKRGHFKKEPARPMAAAVNKGFEQFTEPVSLTEFKEVIDKLLAEMKKSNKF